MKKLISALDRGEVSSFSRNSYEVVFSVFMIAVAYFYRDSPQVAYPRILYFFLLLLGANFVFNWLLRRRTSVNLWLVDLILLVNFWIITGVVHSSGGGASYFWVLYLLPVFAASLMARFKDAAGMVLLCSLAVGAMAWPLGGGEMAAVLALAVKVAVFAFSAGVVYSTAQSKKRAEAWLAFKRGQVETLEKKITESESGIVRTASAVEMGTLVSGVMHDLGNAVSVLLLSAQLAAEDEKPDKADLDRMLKAARYAKGLIAAAMSIVRGQDYVFEEVALKETAETAVLLTSYSARKKEAAVKLDFPEGLPPVRASRAHVERIFINTLGNSLSFVPAGGEVRVAARAADGGVLLEITDNGPGFPAKMLDADVKPFDTTRPDMGGTGLGLYVSAQIARRHGGWLKPDNPPGGGARVSVFLPLEGPREKEEAQA